LVTNSSRNFRAAGSVLYAYEPPPPFITNRIVSSSVCVTPHRAPPSWTLFTIALAVVSVIFPDRLAPASAVANAASSYLRDSTILYCRNLYPRASFNTDSCNGNLAALACGTVRSAPAGGVFALFFVFALAAPAFGVFALVFFAPLARVVFVVFALAAFPVVALVALVAIARVPAARARPHDAPIVVAFKSIPPVVVVIVAVAVASPARTDRTDAESTTRAIARDAARASAPRRAPTTDMASRRRRVTSALSVASESTMFSTPSHLVASTDRARLASTATSLSRAPRSVASRRAGTGAVVASALARAAAGTPKPRRGDRVVVGAHPRRVQKVQQQMRREISNMMQTDKNLRAMISPEERMGVDNILSVMATVAEVEVSNDLQVVKVYVSILGDERGKKNAIKGLKRMEQYVRRKIGRRMSLRLTPEIRFVYDDSFERGQKVNALLDEIRRENRSKTAKKYGKEVLMAVEDVIAERGDVEEDDNMAEWAGDDDAVWDEMLEGVEDALESFDDDEDYDDEDEDGDEDGDGDDGSGIRIIEV